MTSDLPAIGPDPAEAFVWVWLPGATAPVVAGRLAREGAIHVFNYGRSYLNRPDAMPLHLPELPLRPGAIVPDPPLDMAGCLRDAAPDAWGRRVILSRLSGHEAGTTREAEFCELAFLMRSGSDRAGALDFQASPMRYQPREHESASLEALLEAAERVQRGEAVPAALDAALFHGTSIGGARPKALIEDAKGKFIAKFSTASDLYPVVKAEYLAMRLAGAAAGLTAAPVSLARASGRDVLLVRRFDREHTESGWSRRAMVSALTLFGLSEMQARHASYGDLAGIVRARFAAPRATLRELFGRMVFNVLAGNTDDHARNHAAFWDGRQLALTPAYDICPQPRGGREANQAMALGESNGDRRSRLESCRLAAPCFLLTDGKARELIETQAEAVCEAWNAACDEAQLGAADRAGLWRRQFLNDYAFEGYAGRDPRR